MGEISWKVKKFNSKISLTKNYSNVKQIKKENDEKKIVSKLRVHLKLLRRKSYNKNEIM